MSDTKALQAILDYHERTKHQQTRFAAGPGHLDWETQPDPFREWRGAPTVGLPRAAAETKVLYKQLSTPKKISPSMLNVRSIGALFELSLGLSAWKEFQGGRWALRCNPSSGNLHPTEGYLITADIPGLPAGVYHYSSYHHRLERRIEPSESFKTAVFGKTLIGLTSIHWREEWKYGERAWRYCQHDAGHAIAAIRYAAACFGWQVKVLLNAPDNNIAASLGLNRDGDFGGAEREHPDVLMLLESSTGHFAKFSPLKLLAVAHEAGECAWLGEANTLSVRHADEWPVIGEAAEAAVKPVTKEKEWQAQPGALAPPRCEKTAVEIITTRRSAQTYDGETSLSKEAFFRILEATMPRQAAPPFDALPWRPRVHLVLFVHLVEGLEPGLYALPRHEEAEEKLRAAMRDDFKWSPVDGAPESLPLRLLAPGDLRSMARVVSCHQQIASDGAFSLGMLAEFESSLAEGPWWYRRLFWEAGAIGQVFYLEAEAAGVRGTGIGCYFDDAVHDALGLSGHAFQSLYHFTAGAAVEDRRLTTLPPYGHLER